MGRNSKGRRWNQAGPPRRRAVWHDITKENRMFEAYYKALGIVPNEEWDDFMEALRHELPSTFRITGTRSHATTLMQVLKKNYLDPLSDATLMGETAVEPPTSLLWYPDGLAWKLNLSRKVIRKSSSLKKFHSFLVQETECGNISRQEAVSMIPPLLMDIKPGQKVLDACAAPGSKTTQIIEMLHADEFGLPDGLVIANELQNKRCYMLIHQSNRLHSPSCVITNHDASTYPTLYVKGESNSEVPMKFDRILCDVPCSGDGTMRKNPQIWNKWSPHLGIGLHRIQKRILARAVEILEVGGRIVYSTCSMAPVENEAVVAQVLKHSSGALELVDLSAELPRLMRSPGLLTWKLMMKDGSEVTCCDPGSPAHHIGFKAPMLPPSQDEARDMHLERCIRVYPHMQDTGGFFIAALVKKKHAPWENGNRYNDDPKRLPWEREDESISNKQDEVCETSKDESPDTDLADPDHMGEEDTETVAVDPDHMGEDDAETAAADPDHMGEEDTETAAADPDDMGEDTETAAADGDNLISGDALIENDDVTPGDAVMDTTVEEVKDGKRSARDTDVRRKSYQPTRKKPRMDFAFKEDPFILLPDDDPHWPAIRDYFGFSPTFPSSQLVVRSIGGKKRHIYLVSKHVKQVLECVDDSDLKLISAGVKILTRCDGEEGGEFRLMQEGIESILPYVTKRKIYITQEDVFTFLQHDKPFTNMFSQSTREQLPSAPGLGCVLFIYDPAGEFSPPSDTIGCKLCFCGWKARTSLRALMSKNDKMHYLTVVSSTSPGPEPSHVLEPSPSNGSSSSNEPSAVIEPSPSNELSPVPEPSYVLESSPSNESSAVPEPSRVLEPSPSNESSPSNKSSHVLEPSPSSEPSPVSEPSYVIEPSPSNE